MGLLTVNNHVFAVLPLVPPSYLLLRLLLNYPQFSLTESISSQLVTYVALAILGFSLTNQLVPSIKAYTLKRGIRGKDLGKKGTSLGENPIPEALGIVPGTVFLICMILAQVLFASTNPEKLLDCNSALLAICFMLFLGFTDDVLEWPWRYKLILPTVASLPLLCCYKGSTSIVMPIQMRSLLMVDNEVTLLGHMLGYLITIDTETNGKVVNLGIWYLFYMGMLAVFSTNAINIYAGINGLEVGQAYVIACAVLVHNLYEIANHSENAENHLFSVMLMLPFCGVCLGLLKYNWCPASVFVGDTFCYFSGMTFAVVGILGHFSKTLLLFFVPQIINFLWSCPQLFRFVPCPRHRLPRFNGTHMIPSTFPCKPSEFRWIKQQGEATECPNMTVINLALQLLGPLTERDLCLVLLSFQALTCLGALICRHYLAGFFFEP